MNAKTLLVKSLSYPLVTAGLAVVGVMAYMSREEVISVAGKSLVGAAKYMGPISRFFAPTSPGNSTLPVNQASQPNPATQTSHLPINQASQVPSIQAAQPNAPNVNDPGYGQYTVETVQVESDNDGAWEDDDGIDAGYYPEAEGIEDAALVSPVLESTESVSEYGDGGDFGDFDGGPEDDFQMALETTSNEGGLGMFGGLASEMGLGGKRKR